MKQVNSYTPHKQQGLLLNANERSENIPAPVLEAMVRALRDVEFNRYPEDTSRTLRQAYAARLGLKPDQILAGNGSDQMLQVVITTFINKGKTLLTLNPDFSMYDFYVSCNEGNIEKFPTSPDGGFDMDAFIQKARELPASLVLFSNPNNPTGHTLSPEEVKDLCQALDPIPVVMDEAYMEFSNSSALELLDVCDNLYITRTLSKAFGAAGMRVGFLISSESNIETLNAFRPVYNLSSVTSALACALLEHAGLFEKDIEQTRQERERMLQEIESLEFAQAYPSGGNFICLRTPRLSALTSAFEQESVQIRIYGGKDYCRITVGLPAENEKVLEILRRVCQ